MNTTCTEFCFAHIYSRVEDIETLVNYKYVDKDHKVDEMFGGQNFSFPCKDYILYYECPNVHRVKYFCRLLYVCKSSVSNEDSVVHRMCISAVMFDVANNVHVTFRIAIDVTGNQQTNGVSIPLVHLEEVECLGLRLSLHNKEKFVKNTQEKIISLFNLVLENYDLDIYQTQQLAFKKGIYCPLRLISIFNLYNIYRLSILDCIVNSCICKRYLIKCICPKNIYYNRMLISSMSE